MTEQKGFRRGVVNWRGVAECAVDLADYGLRGATYLTKRALIAFAVTAGGATGIMVAFKVLGVLVKKKAGME